MARRPKIQMIEERPTSSTLDENGHEIPDSRPLMPALKLKREPSLAERIRQMVRSDRLAEEARNAGHETFEEADDFEVGDDYDPESPYEMDFDPRPQAAPPQAEPAKQPDSGANPEPTPKAPGDGSA